MTKITFYIYLTAAMINVNGKLLDTSHEILSRQRRFLVWKEGINWVQMIAGIGLPIELRDQAITVGTVVKAYYILPNNSTQYTQPSIDYARKKRSATRWTVYKLIENIFQSYGYGDGKACLLRSICEVSSKPFDRKTGVLAEIVHAVLTPSTTSEILNNHLNSDYHSAERLGKTRENCSLLYPECSTDWLRQFTRFLSW